MTIALIGARRSTPATPAPAELGAVVDAEQIRGKFFQGRVSREWVLAHVAPDQKFYMGRVAVWYEGHVQEWMPTYVAQQQKRAKGRRRSAGR